MGVTYLLDTHVLLWLLSDPARVPEEASITQADAALAGSMSWPHRDPFDRLLVAQATLRGSTLVTVDAAMTDLRVPTVVSW